MPKNFLSTWTWTWHLRSTPGWGRRGKARRSASPGSLIGFDFHRKARTQLDFFDAVISEVSFPSLLAGSTDPIEMTVKLAPERIDSRQGDGRAVSAARPRLNPGALRVVIDGTDCTRVTRVDPFTVSLPVRARVEDPIATNPHFINFPNLRITSSAVLAETWINWHDDFVVKGNNGKDQERRGSFVFLTGDLQKEAARIDLFQLGIFRLSRAMDIDQSDTVTADIYCERMEFHGAGSVLLEVHDEWQVSERRYLSEAAMAKLAVMGNDDGDDKEVGRKTKELLAS